MSKLLHDWSVLACFAAGCRIHFFAVVKPRPSPICALAWAMVLPLVGAADAAPTSPTEASALEYTFKTWETDEGLPDNSVTCINQTRDGYLWIGTFKGLARFDGKRFVIFDSNSTPGLSSSTILGMYPDRTGRLWITHGREKISLWERGTFRDVPVPTFGAPGRNGVWCFGEDEVNRLWVLGRQAGALSARATC